MTNDAAVTNAAAQPSPEFVLAFFAIAGPVSEGFCPKCRVETAPLTYSEAQRGGASGYCQCCMQEYELHSDPADDQLTLSIRNHGIFETVTEGGMRKYVQLYCEHMKQAESG